MFARTALARLRAKVPSAAARDVAQLSRKLRTVVATSASNTAVNNASAAAPLTFAQFQRIRGYATATKTRASTAAKKAPAKKTTTTKKAAAAKKTTATKKKTAAKPKKKAVAKPKKKELTEFQIERLEKRKLRDAEQKKKDHLKELKAMALQEPKQKPASPFQILLVETIHRELTGTKGASRIGEIAKAVSQQYKNLSPSELERLNRAANEAAEENKKAYKKWVESYTPMQIREANNARRQLKAKLVNYNKGQIQDDRAVATPASAYIIFFKERYATGEFKNMSTTEAAKLVGAEWKALSASSKEKYENMAAEEKQRYARKYKSVYGVEPSFQKRAAATA